MMDTVPSIAASTPPSSPSAFSATATSPPGPVPRRSAAKLCGTEACKKDDS
eukprot:CAMPEP_0115312124 /NCGR_PEP_ID=MMETSP0270-20121206/75717_1 /TAXON_ID=71861 /ORGANISM="Scrippsiella trochoidea, Strain CCMP3099" /LENGTH=50 /DNA_ID=CAMNT_0002731033 /DNA_START=16 /DNA_END=164 /DNA_ORIENTATION=+